jgi:hypothetical protein
VPSDDCARREEIPAGAISKPTFVGSHDLILRLVPVDARMLKTQMMPNLRNPLFEEMIDL